MLESNSVERWLPVSVSGYEHAYLVSDRGRVYSVPRQVVDCNGVVKPIAGRILKPTPHNSAGHLYVSLCTNGVSDKYFVHSLVLSAFVGACPPGMEACHGPNGHIDNSVGNLRWDTHTANMLDRRRDGTHYQIKKTKCPFGHLLMAPNLVESRDVRCCKSCQNARVARVIANKRGWPFDFESVANRNYKRVMGGPQNGR